MHAGKIALITGANKGLGKAIAHGLGKQGCTVLLGARDAKKGEVVAAQFAQEGIQARCVELDVTQTASIKAAEQWLTTHYGKLDILINNAGIAIDKGRPPSQTDLAIMQQTYQTNVFGPLSVTQAMLPLLKKAAAGRIVNMSSSLGSLTGHSDPTWVYASVNALAYCSSKTALNSITVMLAKELRGTPIKINAVCPGYCATDLNDHAGPRSPEQGAVIAIRLALLAADGPSGGFFDEDGPIAW